MPVAKESGKDFTPIPAGTHIARCFGVVSLGTQTSPNFPSSFKVMLMFEVPGETILIDNKPTPMTIQREYTLSLSEKANLRHHLESWRGRAFTSKELEGFEVQKVLGQPCMLSVIHKTTGKGKLYAAIAGISGLPKSVACPPQVHASVHFEIEDGKHDAYNALPEWIRKKIDACEEWLHPAAAQPEPEPEPESEERSDDPDSVPF